MTSSPSRGGAVVDASEMDGWSEVGVFNAIFGLRATRIYHDRPVPPEILARILRAATMACSSGNTQPWEFVVVTDLEQKRRLKSALAAAYASTDAQRSQTADQLVDGVGRPITGHAAVDNVDRVGALVMVFWNPDRGIRFQGEYEEAADGTLRPLREIIGGRGSSLYPACQNMMLAANSLGISSLFTTFFGLVAPEVKEILNVPPRMFLEAAIFLGYGDEELKRPRRRSLGEVVHMNDWDIPYESIDTTGAVTP